jgi:hypothetical protein
MVTCNLKSFFERNQAMKAQNILIFYLIIMFTTIASLQADERQQAYLGVRLDPNPLSELLTKHLKLEPGQGLLIKNIYINSPADKAGLDRDDIIVTFQGEDIFDYEDFVRDIQRTGVDEEVELKVIHLGEKKTVSAKLEHLNGQFDSDELGWKYPFESEVYQMWRPGRIFRFKPGDEDWTRVPFKDVPDINMDIKKFFKEKYFFQHSSDDEEFSITIEGNPFDGDSSVTLETRQKKERKIYETTIGEIEELPKKYLPTIKKDIEEAQKTTYSTYGMLESHKDTEEAHRDIAKAHEDIGKAQSEMQELHEDLFKEFKIKIPKPEFFRRKLESFDFNDKLQDIQKQMKELQEKMAELEKSLKSDAKETPDQQSSDTLDEQI